MRPDPKATHRFVRGETTPQKSYGIYRAIQRGQSAHMRARVEAVARELARGKLQVEGGKADMRRTRSEIRQAWSAVGDISLRQQQPELARQVRLFQERMSPVTTEKEGIAVQLLKHVRKIQERNRGSPSR